MRKIGMFIGVIFVFSLLHLTQSFAQPGMQWRGGGGWGAGAQYSRMYDPKTVETVSGEVVSVDVITPVKGMCYGIHLMVKTGKETISVHLGPGWYIENQDTKIEAKDKVEITGSRIIFEGKPAIIAAEVKKGEETLKLRDEKGFPLWSGWRKRP
ncbi:MAG: DNA-binding protein [Candidatus Brocadia sp.]|nr:DNA-binding protein [Candidatus Brocadia sp.]MDG6025603.1 DNA-binding protein [Candidatus Brocadia sp.]